MTESHIDASQTVGQLTHLRELVQQAKAVPMSASCMVNRSEVLSIIDGILGALPAELERSRALLSEQSAAQEQAREQAEQIIAEAQAQAREIASETEVARLADEQAADVRQRAEGDADALRVETDRYVDGRLAEFEAGLHKTMSQVTTMRRRLSERSHLDESDVEALPSI